MKSTVRFIGIAALIAGCSASPQLRPSVPPQDCHQQFHGFLRQFEKDRLPPLCYLVIEMEGAICNDALLSGLSYGVGYVEKRESLVLTMTAQSLEGAMTSVLEFPITVSNDGVRKLAAKTADDLRNWRRGLSLPRKRWAVE